MVSGAAPATATTAMPAAERPDGEAEEAPEQGSKPRHPEHSRLFVVHSKRTTAEDLERVCSRYGQVLGVDLLVDDVGAPRGCAFVQMDLTSAAMLAVENLHGAVLATGLAPLKVMISEARGRAVRAVPDERLSDEDRPRHSRLCVVIPKTMVEDDVRKHFGDDPVTNCRVVRDAATQQGRGIAYVKFPRASAAALAMERLNVQHAAGEVELRAFVAEPRAKPIAEVAAVAAGATTTPANYPSFGMAMSPYYDIPPAAPRQRLFVVCDRSISREQLARVFARFPGMEYCDLKVTAEGMSRGIAYVNYSTPSAAAAACRALDGYAVARGMAIKVMFAEPLPTGPAERRNKAPQQEHLPRGSRLFVSLTKALPGYLLSEIFGALGPLEYVRLQPGKNFGFAKYRTAQAAALAIRQLDGSQIHGQTIKVVLARDKGST